MLVAVSLGVWFDRGKKGVKGVVLLEVQCLARGEERRAEQMEIGQQPKSLTTPDYSERKAASGKYIIRTEELAEEMIALGSWSGHDGRKA